MYSSATSHSQCMLEKGNLEEKVQRVRETRWRKHRETVRERERETERERGESVSRFHNGKCFSCVL